MARLTEGQLANVLKRLSEFAEASAATPTAEQLRLVARRAMIEASPEVQSLFENAPQYGRLKFRVRKSNLSVTVADVHGGHWVFVRGTVDGNTVIISEAFIAAERGTPIPPRPVLVGGKAPRWLVKTTDPATGKGRVMWRLVDVPPPVATASPQPFRLTPEALRDAPNVLTERWESAAAAARERGLSSPLPRNPPLELIKVPPGLGQTAGMAGIRSIEYLVEGRPSQNIDRLWNVKVRIRGRTGPRINRTNDEALYAEATKLYGPEVGATLDRCHLVGAIFGDSTVAGMGFNLKTYNQRQLATVERFLRLQSSNVAGSVEYEITGYLKYEWVGGEIIPRQTSAHYKFDDFEWDVWVEGNEVKSTFDAVEKVLKAGSN